MAGPILPEIESGGRAAVNQYEVQNGESRAKRPGSLFFTYCKDSELRKRRHMGLNTLVSCFRVM